MKTLESIYLQIIKENTELEVDMGEPFYSTGFFNSRGSVGSFQGGLVDLNEYEYDGNVDDPVYRLCKQSVPFIYVGEEDLTVYGPRELVDKATKIISDMIDKDMIPGGNVFHILAKELDIAYVADFEGEVNPIEEVWDLYYEE